MPTKRAAGVVDFVGYKNRALIDILDEAIEQAESGEISGAILVFKRGHLNQGVAVVGEYENDPELICDIASKLFAHFQPLVAKNKKH